MSNVTTEIRPSKRRRCTSTNSRIVDYLLYTAGHSLLGDTRRAATSLLQQKTAADFVAHTTPLPSLAEGLLRNAAQFDRHRHTHDDTVSTPRHDSMVLDNVAAASSNPSSTDTVVQRGTARRPVTSQSRQAAAVALLRRQPLIVRLDRRPDCELCMLERRCRLIVLARTLVHVDSHAYPSAQNSTRSHGSYWCPADATNRLMQHPPGVRPSAVYDELARLPNWQKLCAAWRAGRSLPLTAVATGLTNGDTSASSAQPNRQACLANMPPLPEIAAWLACLPDDGDEDDDKLPATSKPYHAPTRGEVRKLYLNALHLTALDALSHVTLSGNSGNASTTSSPPIGTVALPDAPPPLMSSAAQSALHHRLADRLELVLSELLLTHVPLGNAMAGLVWDDGVRDRWLGRFLIPGIESGSTNAADTKPLTLRYVDWRKHTITVMRRELALGLPVPDLAANLPPLDLTESPASTPESAAVDPMSMPDSLRPSTLVREDTSAEGHLHDGSGAWTIAHAAPGSGGLNGEVSLNDDSAIADDDDDEGDDKAAAGRRTSAARLNRGIFASPKTRHASFTTNGTLAAAQSPVITISNDLSTALQNSDQTSLDDVHIRAAQAWIPPTYTTLAPTYPQSTDFVQSSSSAPKATMTKRTGTHAFPFVVMPASGSGRGGGSTSVGSQWRSPPTGVTSDRGKKAGLSAKSNSGPTPKQHQQQQQQNQAQDDNTTTKKARLVRVAT
ncbi:hypothetical protein PYCC9005_003344 [Savitreella phatthalungensis]